MIRKCPLEFAILEVLLVIKPKQFGEGRIAQRVAVHDSHLGDPGYGLRFDPPALEGDPQALNWECLLSTTRCSLKSNK